MVKKSPYMICVSSSDKVLDLVLSDDLTCLAPIRSKYEGCKVEVFCIGMVCGLPAEKIEEKSPYKYSRNGKPSANNVRCKETGIVYSSVKDCSRKTGISPSNIYKSILLSYKAGGFTFEYAHENNDKKDKEV